MTVCPFSLQRGVAVSSQVSGRIVFGLCLGDRMASEVKLATGWVRGGIGGRWFNPAIWPMVPAFWVFCDRDFAPEALDRARSGRVGPS